MVRSEMFLITEYLLLVQTVGTALWFFNGAKEKALYFDSGQFVLASLVLQKYNWANGHLLNEEKKDIWTEDRCIGLYK